MPKPKREASPLQTTASVKVLAVQFNARELDTLRKAMEEHRARGSRVTVSQLIRWAVTHTDFSEMPEVP
jgi:hypothetical protein